MCLRPAASGGGSFRVEVRSNPSFGPLLRIVRPPAPPIVRITPLTDNDIREVLEASAIPPQAAIEELLGRLSQLIEELPWLTEIDADVRASADGELAGLSEDARLSFTAPRSAVAAMAAQAVGGRT